MPEFNNSKVYDLEKRTLNFAIEVRLLVNSLPKQTSNYEDGKQVTRSSGSVGSNYIEANEALSKKDFNMRIKICRKEAKETHYWLTILGTINLAMSDKIELLLKETVELRKIFSSILDKSRI